MYKISLSFLSVIMMVFGLQSCPPPRNIEGVAFTSGEKLYLDKLMGMGVENVNYIKEGESPRIGIKYISHYDSRAIVFIGTYGVSYLEGINLNCMGVIFDGPIPAIYDLTTYLPRDFFDFAKAVEVELEWLVNNGIIDISKDKIDEISLALSDATNGGGQYWTHVKNILGYNSWYEFDSVKGVWSTGENGVRGVNVAGGCSVVYPGDGLPSEPIGVSVVKESSVKKYKSSHKAIVGALNVNETKVCFIEPLREDAILSIYDCRGVLVFTRRVSTGLKSIYTPQLRAGYYTVKISTKR